MDKAPRVNSTVASLFVAALAAGAIAIAVENLRITPRIARVDGPTASPVAAVQSAQAQRQSAPARAGGWTASAAGRVEPKDGEIRLGAQMPGKVTQVLARMNDKVKAGDLLVRLADEELLARLAGATAEAAVRRRERDSELGATPEGLARRRPGLDVDPALKQSADRRNGEDAVFAAERALFKARMDLDRLQATSGIAAKGVDGARAAVQDADAKLKQEIEALRKVVAQPGSPLPTRLEASLTVARAELSAIEQAVEKTRIRAPSDGTVLLVNTRAGETVTPSPEDVLVQFGDLTQLRVRAEIEERDVGRIRSGQSVVVRSDSFPGIDFNGRVELMAHALGSPRLATKGPRRVPDQDVLQVVVELEGQPPLIPGMRVDVFFKPDATTADTPPASAVNN